MEAEDKNADEADDIIAPIKPHNVMKVTQDGVKYFNVIGRMPSVARWPMLLRWVTVVEFPKTDSQSMGGEIVKNDMLLPNP